MFKLKVLSKIANSMVKLFNILYKKGCMKKEVRDDFYNCLLKAVIRQPGIDIFSEWYTLCKNFRITNFANTIFDIWKEES